MERPTGVTILAVLYFIFASFLGLCGILFIVGGSMLSGLAHGGGLGSALFAMGGVVVGGWPSELDSSSCRTGLASSQLS
jgi:hypothetical protein